MSTCRVCRKPIQECEKADKQLITPYDPRNKLKLDPGFISRFSKTLSYALGGYDATSDVYYFKGTHISDRLHDDSILSLPLCVWEGRYTLLELFTISVVEINVYELPIPRKWHDLLLELFSPQINAYMSSLSQADSRMPRS